MLHIFHVDSGRMMTFDMSLALESVAKLKSTVQDEFKIAADKQVLLISGGECLDSNKRVCSYSAGTDTNPIFLFSKSIIENPTSPTAPADPKSERDTNMELCLMEHLDMPISITTVNKRAYLSQSLFENARMQMSECKMLVHDQHLQHQGWSAVIANLDDLASEFFKRVEIFRNTVEQYLGERKSYFFFLENFNKDLDLLKRIPLLSVLRETENKEAEDDEKKETEQDESNDVENEDFNESEEHKEDESLASSSQDITLYDWVLYSDNKATMDQLYEHCSRGIQQFNTELFELLQEDFCQISSDVANSQLKEVTGLAERLSGLEILMREAKNLMNQQADLAQSFNNNLVSASTAKDVSVLPELCMSHKKQLLMMLDCHKRLTDIKRRCFDAKNELKLNLYRRLRWVMFLEDHISEVDQKIVIYHENLKRLRHHFEVMQQIHVAPVIYLTAAAEVSRRRTFSDSFMSGATQLVCHLVTLHNREVARRKKFQSQIEGHFLSELFPGLDDMPPALCSEVPAKFDTGLPKISREDVNRLISLLPDLAENLNSLYARSHVVQSYEKEEEKTEKPNEGADWGGHRVVQDADIVGSGRPVNGWNADESPAQVWNDANQNTFPKMDPTDESMAQVWNELNKNTEDGWGNRNESVPDKWGQPSASVVQKWDDSDKSTVQGQNNQTGGAVDTNNLKLYGTFPGAEGARNCRIWGSLPQIENFYPPQFWNEDRAGDEFRNCESEAAQADRPGEINRNSPALEYIPPIPPFSEKFEDDFRSFEVGEKRAASPEKPPLSLSETSPDKDRSIPQPTGDFSDEDFFIDESLPSSLSVETEEGQGELSKPLQGRLDHYEYWRLQCLLPHLQRLANEGSAQLRRELADLKAFVAANCANHALCWQEVNQAAIEKLRKYEDESWQRERRLLAELANSQEEIRLLEEQRTREFRDASRREEELEEARKAREEAEERLNTMKEQRDQKVIEVWDQAEKIRELEEALMKGRCELKEVRKQPGKLMEKLVQAESELKTYREQLTGLQSRLEKSDKEMAQLRWDLRCSRLEAEQLREQRRELTEAREAAVREATERLGREHRDELERLRLRFKLMQSDCVGGKLTGEEVAQMQANFELDKEAAVGEAVRRVTEEKDAQIEALLAANAHSRLRIAEAEKKNKEVEEEDEKEQENAIEGDEEEGVAEATSRMQEGKTDAATQKDDKPTKKVISVDTCKSNDLVVVLWDPEHDCFKVLQENKHLYFVHSESLEGLGLEVKDAMPNRVYAVGVVVDKEYCCARKAENRYKVPIHTKFFRVKVGPATVIRPPKDSSQSVYLSKAPVADDVERMTRSQSSAERHPMPHPESILAGSERDEERLPPVHEADTSTHFAEDSGIVDSASAASDDTFVRTSSRNESECSDRMSASSENSEEQRTYISSTWLEAMLNRVFTKTN